ncbi:MAG TPA: hypothetical protein PK205_15540 [Promineifilum sp.]|nr:hypothetical protein [Promineifilum sp.]HRQ14714.1 hypothetical protein [Promineifilum sp.]
MATDIGTGTGTKTTGPTPAQTAEQSIIIIRDFKQGEIVRVTFLTPDQAKALPTIPPDALQIAIAPAGGL